MPALLRWWPCFGDGVQIGADASRPLVLLPPYFGTTSLLSGDPPPPYLVLPCDQEEAIMGIRKGVMCEISNFIPREAPLESHESNGMVERYHQTIQGLART